MKSYERSDLMEQADVMVMDMMKTNDLSDHETELKRAVHWSVNAVCNRLWVKNNGKEPVIDEAMAASILDEVKTDLENRCKALVEKEQETELELD